MKFLTDENVYSQIVEVIRSLSYDVLDIKEQNLFSAPDYNIIQMAEDTGRILITFDKDFSNILTYPPSQYQGIIVLRLSRMTINGTIKQLIGFLKTLTEEKIRGKLAILEPGRVRYRR